MPNDEVPDGQTFGKRDSRENGSQKNGRKCILTNETGPVETLIRLVPSPDGVLVPDVAARLPGRGVRMQTDGALIRAAVDNGSLHKAACRSLKCKLPKGAVSDDLAEQIEGLLVRRCLDRLGLEQRAGHVVTGFDKIKAALGKKSQGQPIMLVEAVDGSEDGRRKIQAAVGNNVPTVAVFDREALSGALGRENVVHVLLVKSGGTKKLMVDISRLLGMRGLASLNSEA